jgi:hypothetical protein
MRLRLRRGPSSNSGSSNPTPLSLLLSRRRGALGKDALKLFKALQKEAGNQVRYEEGKLLTWSAPSFAAFFLQSLSIANIRGQGHLLMTAAASARADSQAGFGH